MKTIKPICCKADFPLIKVMGLFEKATEHFLPGGIALVLDDDERLIGTITEGDVRRKILRDGHFDLVAGELMNQDPIAFNGNSSISEILEQLPFELAKRNRRSSRYLSKIVRLI